jgi:RNA polymerase sigma factor (sigma-70 family)
LAAGEFLPVMTWTDEALMLAVKDGDVAKLGVLFERHHRALFDFFARMTGNRQASEDLVQDVFFRILKYRNTYRNESQFTTWMYHIARNTRFDQFKKRRPELVFPEEEIQIAAQGISAARQVEHDQEKELLDQALLKLNQDRRELLILARYREMKYEQIAEVFGVDVGTIKVRVHRAMKELREIFLKLSGEKPSCNVKRSEINLRII